MREKTLDGHVCEAAGMCSSVTRGGRMMWKPLTKNSYRCGLVAGSCIDSRACRLEGL